MNSLVFDPQIHTVAEWIHLYLSQTQISHFQAIIDRTVNYLQVIEGNRLKKRQSMNTMNSAFDAQPDLPPVKTKRKLKRTTSIRDEGGIQNFIEEVNAQRVKFQEEYQEAIKLMQDQGGKVSDVETAEGASLLKNKISVCEKHLKALKTKGISFYDEFLQQQDELLESFFKFKMFELNKKKQKIARYLSQSDSFDFRSVEKDVRVLFDNLYIQTEYLRMFIKKNMDLLDNHSDKENADEPEVTAFKDRELFKLRNCQKALDELKKEIQQIYFQNYRKKKSKKIRDYVRLQNYIKEEIAVNAEQFTPLGTWTSWSNGFNCAFLLVALLALIIFRQTNISSLQESASYRIEFTVWRGASYLIWFNWVCAIVLFIFDHVGINYRLILMEDGFFVQKYQSFIRSASLMTAIYLVLFFVYLLNATGYITGYPWISNFGYYMWIINIVYILNPFKILNYHSRIYFLYLLCKNLICPFKPINMNIFFLGIIIGSFAQPMNDLVFTICSLRYSDELICEEQGRVGTFIFMLIFSAYRLAQTYRLHTELGQGKKCSRAINGGVAVCCGINTVIASYLYGTYATQNLMTYWIISAAIGTLANINADYRADWGILSFDQEDCLLRKYTFFSRKTFLVWCIVDAFLNVVWILTISNALRAFLQINALYFFMILTYIEFSRKGLWMVFRIEDDHAVNIGNLIAMKDDSEFWQKVDKALGMNKESKKQSKLTAAEPLSKNTSQIELNSLTLAKAGQSGEQIRQQDTLVPPPFNQKIKAEEEEEQISPFTLQELQEMVIRKKVSLQKVNSFLESLEGYLNIIDKIYKKLDWNDEY